MRALRAEKSASLPQPFGPDGCAANEAGFAPVPIDVQGQLKVPRLALAVAEVAQGGATGLDGAGQGRADGARQMLVFGQADAPGRARGADAGGEPRLVGGDV